MSDPLFSDNDEKHAAGFVLNKLYNSKCFGRRGNTKHNRHMQLDNMPKGYPYLDKRGLIKEVCLAMNGTVVLIFKSQAEDHICALHETDAMKVGLEICNFYRSKVGLPPLDAYFKELTITEEEEEASNEPYKKMTDKEKRTEEWRKKAEKWMKDQGLT